jgi:hypothetical protein
LLLEDLQVAGQALSLGFPKHRLEKGFLFLDTRGFGQIQPLIRWDV